MAKTAFFLVKRTVFVFHLNYQNLFCGLDIVVKSKCDSSVGVL